MSLEQVKEDNVGREDDQERAYRRLHNIGQNEVSRLKGLINGVRGVGGVKGRLRRDGFLTYGQVPHARGEPEGVRGRRHGYGIARTGQGYEGSGGDT